MQIKDFKDEATPQYASVHLYFTERESFGLAFVLCGDRFLCADLTDDTFKKIGACAPLKKRIKALKELSCDELYSRLV